MIYRNFDLWVDRWADGRLRLHAVAEGLGEVPEDWADLGAAADGLAQEVASLSRNVLPPARLQALGVDLFTCLFRTGERRVEGLLRQALGAVLDDPQEALRIRLRLGDGQAAAMPWEFLYDPDGMGYLATSSRTALVRWMEVPLPIRSLLCPLPMAMLVVIPGGTGLNVAGEKARLQKVFSPLTDTLQVRWLEGDVTRQALAEALTEQDPSILHFIGHGEFIGDRAALRLVASDGEVDWVDHEAFGALFRNHRSLKLVVLNACQGATSAVGDPRVGLAQQLVLQGLPAVVAMQLPIHDDDALDFSRSFYHHLFLGAERGRVDLALSQARGFLAAQRPDSVAQGTPVLFMRAPEGLLFDYAVRPAILPSAADRQREELRRRTHLHNIQVLQADPAAGGELAAEQAALAGLQRMLRWRRASLWSAALLALLVFAAAWTALPDVLGLSTRADLLGAWLGEQFVTASFDPRIAVLRIDQVSREQAGKPVFDAEWRSEVADLVADLAAVDARVVALDIFFEADRPELDEQLVEGFQAARAADTEVVLAARHPSGAGPLVTAAALDNASGWGLACLGQPLGRSLYLPLAVGPSEGADDGQPMPARASALAVQTWIAFNGGSLAAAGGVELEPQRCNVRLPPNPGVGHSMDVDCLHLDPDPGTQQACSWLQRDSPAYYALLEPTPLALLRAPGQSFTYGQFQAASEEERRAFADGRMVLVGVEDATDEHDVGRGFGHARRWGVEIHADLLSALCRGQLVRRPGAGVLFLVLMATALLTAAAYTRMGRWRRWQRGLAVLGLYLAYLALGVFCYVDQRLLLSPLDGALAVSLPVLVAGWLLRRAGPMPATPEPP